MSCKGVPQWFDMGETEYRASQICRLLGNPKVYQILKDLESLVGEIRRQER